VNWLPFWQKSSKKRLPNICIFLFHNSVVFISFGSQKKM